MVLDSQASDETLINPPISSCQAKSRAKPARGVGCVLLVNVEGSAYSPPVCSLVSLATQSKVCDSQKYPRQPTEQGRRNEPGDISSNVASRSIPAFAKMIAVLETRNSAQDRSLWKLTSSQK